MSAERPAQAPAETALPPARPKRITMHVFTEGQEAYLCGEPRTSRVHKTHVWAMEATGEAVVRDCELCGILHATEAAGR